MTETAFARPGEVQASARVSRMVRQTGILLVGDFLSSSVGGRAVCEDLAERLPEVGFQVTTTSRCPARLARLSDMLWTTWHRRSDYDVAQIDVFSDLAFIWAEATVALLRRLNKPYVLTLHGGDLPKFARLQPRRVTRLLGGAALVTTPSPFLLREMSSYRSDLTLLPNPVELSNYEYRPRLAPTPRLIWLRAFHRVYNPRLAVRVLAELKKSHPDACLTMVGPDKRDGSLEETHAEAARLGVLADVEFVGGVPKADVPLQLQRGDVFLNTSDTDNAPVTVLEPMACGIPVVSTNAGGIPDLVRDGIEALLVPCDDAEAMAVAVRSLVDHPERVVPLVEAAYARVLEHDWSRVLPQWRDLFDSLVASADKRALFEGIAN